jgi:cobalt-zinc-cadmium efflux system outer membrane protein
MFELASATVIVTEGFMKGLLIAGLTAAVLAATAATAAGNADEATGISVRGASALKELIAEAMRANPEIRAAENERLAARQRVAPAGALDDPMVEAGLLNVPTTSYRLNREDMTMKMLGVAQKLPWPGKRALREQVAAKDASGR